MTTRIAIIGLGKIARDQHVPAIAADPDFTLVAVVSGSGAGVAGVPVFADLAGLMASGIGVDAVALCMPPGPRAAVAHAALAAGYDVLMEKPPAATLGEAEGIVAAAGGRVLFAAWHSRFAAGVAPAAAALAGRAITGVAVTWREDVRRWHPGQGWIWAADGFGVLDPGINALSILTAILPGPLRLKSAALDYPEGRAAPIAAQLAIAGAGFGVTCDFDWRHGGDDIWQIRVDTTAGAVVLDRGGAALSVDGVDVALPPTAEYPGLYRHFAGLRAAGRSDCDLAPLALALDTVGNGSRRTVAAFVEP